MHRISANLCTIFAQRWRISQRIQIRLNSLHSENLFHFISAEIKNDGKRNYCQRYSITNWKWKVKEQNESNCLNLLMEQIKQTFIFGGNFWIWYRGKCLQWQRLRVTWRFYIDLFDLSCKDKRSIIARSECAVRSRRQEYSWWCETCNKKIEFIEKYERHDLFIICLDASKCLMLYGSRHVQGNALFMDYSISRR